MKTAICYVLFAVLCPFVLGQNLVVNPSFEIQSSCPFGLSMLNRATPWLPGKSTPDYLHTCPGTSCCDLPSNYFGYENAATGNGCAGAIFYGSFANYYIANFREFLYGTLSSPLNPGQTYYVSFKVNLVDTASFACNNLGIQFEDAYSTAYPLNNMAHVFTPSIITTQTGWVSIQGTFVPSMAYSHFYVGNFFVDSLTSIVNVGPTTNDWMAYYYLDDFCVSPNPSQCGTFLAMEWLNWEAEWANDSVVLAWATTGEAVGSYTVEESWDGAHFVAIAEEIEVQGEVMDYRHQPSLRGRNAFYRIRAVDRAGQSHLSSVARVTIPGSPKETFAIWPNPAQMGDAIQLRLPDTDGAPIRLIWMNGLGQTVASLDLAPQEIIGETAIAMPDLSPGVYFLSAQHPQWKVVSQWVLQE